MSKPKPDDQPDAVEATAVPGLKPALQGFPVTTEAAKPLGPLRVFRDKVFTSRTLLLPDGRTAAVVAGRVTAFGDEWFDYLKAHPDFELLPE
jgi:hypothetical protein